MASDDNPRVRDALRRSMQEMAPYINLGFQMAVAIVLFTLFGWWLDGRFKTSPLFILIFAAIGVFAAFYYFFKAVRKK